ncbi:MAG: 1-(5-phosphoribosyl)-5-[(5-phosphoribosylamino)methylideneamino]imidazole-4-carboxamide isomerase [Ferruginibacter sp.]
MQIIPAIDIIEGKAVRLTKGDYAQQKVYSDQPVELARQFEDAGLQRLHLVDLDGAKAGKVQHIHLLEKIAKATRLQVDFGGGVKTKADVQQILDAGAAMVTIGSLAVKQPALLQEWVDDVGAEKFFIGADVLNRQIRIHGWLEDGGKDIFSFIRSMQQAGLTQIFCTDIEKDGALQGTSDILYRDIIEQFPLVQLTASGGVSNMDDLFSLQQTGCHGAIVGKAIYEGRISLAELQQFQTA